MFPSEPAKAWRCRISLEKIYPGHWYVDIQHSGWFEKPEGVCLAFLCYFIKTITPSNLKTFFFLGPRVFLYNNIKAMTRQEVL